VTIFSFFFLVGFKHGFILFTCFQHGISMQNTNNTGGGGDENHTFTFISVDKGFPPCLLIIIKSSLNKYL
jgi:hypothetical protein